jgi:hypothetical protein
MPGIFALIGIILLVLAGLNVGTARFEPAWFGFAFLALAFFWAPVIHVTG